ncbi:MAG: hypothetical protein H7Z72_07495 [Bacteroidetes bacterium]|nr:hypothetical protein [Fibrella sp.]
MRFRNRNGTLTKHKPDTAMGFKEAQQRASQIGSGLINRGQTIPSQFAAKPTPANTGLDSMMRARMSMLKRQQEAHAQQHLRKIEREARVNSAIPSGRLIVPVAENRVIRSTELIPTLFNINRSGYNRPAKSPKIIQQQVDIKFDPKIASSPGIVIYGKCSRESDEIPIFIIKTGLIKAKVYTDYPSELKPVDPVSRQYTTIIDPHARCKAAPAVIDLTRYDNIRSLSDLNPYCDAVIVNVGGDFAFAGGTGAGLQIVIIVRGGDQGLYVYRPTVPNANLGFFLSAGMTTGTVYFNEKNNKRKVLDRDTFAGDSQGWSVGDGGIGKSTSYADGKRHYQPWRLKEDDILYSAITGSAPGMGLSFEVAAGAQYSFSRSALWLEFNFAGNPRLK